MDRDQANSGSDDIAKYTREDEEKMDRVSQAGMEGAFGAGDQQVEESVREDAEQTFNKQDQGGSGGRGSGRSGSSGS